ncbi:hypothetical protein V1477_011430 [Vespula maculifrons]|uniref:Uncharacterized protein n=1 Tax=Vespula maculifrons TaxID=7453 RepID=A0ABD2BZ57_VESMC
MLRLFIVEFIKVSQKYLKTLSFTLGILDNEDAYESEDLEEMLEELAIEKEEELINTVGKRASNRIKSSDVTPGPDIVVDETIVS